MKKRNRPTGKAGRQPGEKTERLSTDTLTQLLPSTTPSSADFQPTDAGNAERFVARHGKDLRYVHEWGVWLIWDGRRWAPDRIGQVMERAKETIRAAYASASEVVSDDSRRALAKHLLNSEAGRALREMIFLAQTNPAVAVTADQLDADPMLFNVLNGTLDLRTGVLSAHQPEDLLTKLAPVEHDPKAKSATWERFLRQSTGGDEELAAFLARAAGYSLTGDTSEEVLFFIHGPAAAGKSTFIEAIRAVLGDYAATADFDAFLKRSNVGSPRDDIARLAGSRFVSSVEVDDGRKLADGIVKQLTGGDTVTARRLYKEAFEFRPQFKLWLVANDAPDMRASDEALWRRVLRVPFEHCVPPEKRDKALKVTLRDDPRVRAAILTWAMRGLRDWRENGLAVPSAITTATTELRRSMNPLDEFIASECIEKPAAWTSTTALYDTYQVWAERSGERPIPKRAFGHHLGSLGYTDKRSPSGKARGWLGLALRIAGEE